MTSYIHLYTTTEYRKGNGNPLQYSCLENPMDRGAWWATAQSGEESDKTERLSMNVCTRLCWLFTLSTFTHYCDSLTHYCKLTHLLDREL